LLMLGRRIFIDIWITAFMSLTLVFFALSERFPERRRLFLILMYVAAGLGMLTKGPVAIVLPGLAFLLYLLVQRELRRAGEMMLPLGALIVLLIVVPWYAALYHAHGWEYIRSFIVSENLERYTSGYGVYQDRSPWFYVPVVLGDSFPLVTRADCRRARGVAGAGPLHRPDVVLDRRHRRILLVVGGQAGPVYLSELSPQPSA
jgi:4-amino-4-deoxy-L-arabinose transferase-like glycosyltransferase